MVEKITIPAEYSDFIDIFSQTLAAKLPKQLDINQYTINLETSKQPSYKTIYILKSIELETFKIYIEINLANNFIRLFKSFAKALILFI